MSNKTPTLREKVQMYEDFLHKLNLMMVCGNSKGINTLLQNADNWSYGHRFGNGEISERDQQKTINRAFWKLCNLE